MFLTPQEIVELTGRKSKAGQVRALKEMGIEHIARADGFPIVLHSHIEKRLDGLPDRFIKKEYTPNLDGVNA